MTDPDPGPEPSEPPDFSDGFKNDSWWPYEDMQDPPECSWNPVEMRPGCDWDPACGDHNWLTPRQRTCQRCRGTGIDPEHSHSGMYDDGYMEPPVLEPCVDCSFPVSLIKDPARD